MSRQTLALVLQAGLVIAMLTFLAVLILADGINTAATPVAIAVVGFISLMVQQFIQGVRTENVANDVQNVKLAVSNMQEKVEAINDGPSAGPAAGPAGPPA